MYLGATPIWETWTAGGPFAGDRRANGRIIVESDWTLTFSETPKHRGRGTWWREDPSTLTEFATATSWVVDSRNRAGARSFQQVRNGEWAYWGVTSEGEQITPPSGSYTRASFAMWLKGTADASSGTDLPVYDGTMDYPDIGHLPYVNQAAIGQLTQAGVFLAFPDGTFKPSSPVTAIQKTALVSRLQDYLYGAENPGRAAVEVPNVDTIAWDRSIDSDLAEVTISINNLIMKPNEAAQADPNELGLPGYFSPTRGENTDATARWGNHTPNEWARVIMPNSLIRTYEGYGGEDLSVKDAVDQGFLRQTGTWLVDRVTIGTNGLLQIQGRDVGRLLTEQFLKPPIVPVSVYPLRYCRYVTLEPTPDYPEGEERSGNYKDYADIIYDMLIWSGFYYDSFPTSGTPVLGGGPEPDASAEGFAQVHGIIETTGAYADECLPDDMFYMRPVIDAITEIRNIVGYLFWIDEEGGAHFQSPNWFEPGNFDENAVHIDFVPEVDEVTHLFDYTASLSSENLRTEIVISSEAVPPVPPYGSSEETYRAYKDAISRATFYTPEDGQDMAHGMHLPAMWVNGAFSDPDEQETMAKLIALHVHYRHRQGSLTMIGNPCIQVNDQVRILERQTDETYIHYVRGISSSLSNATGEYRMTLTTHWMGDGNDWSGDRFEGTRIATLNPGS